MKVEEQELQFAKEIQRIILDRIHERRRKMHKLNPIVYDDNLWLQIQTLEWVLSQIRSIRRMSASI
jgi:hypothetical protein